jgi:hypothetical protein
MADEEEWTCPGCGLPDEELPVGHCLSTPMDGSAPSCTVITNTVSLEEFTAGTSRPIHVPGGKVVVRDGWPYFDPAPLDGAGAFLKNMLGGPPEPGPPYTHTLAAPEPTGEDEDGNDIYPPPDPSHTLRAER